MTMPNTLTGTAGKKKQMVMKKGKQTKAEIESRMKTKGTTIL